MPNLRFTIVAKLTLLVLAVGLPLSGILAWSLQTLFHRDAAAAEQHAVSIANDIATRAEIAVARTRAVLVALGKRPAVQALDRSRCDPFLDDLRQLTPQFANINTFNLQWEFVCSATSRNTGLVIRSAYPELYERMKAVDDMALSGPVRGQLTGRLVVIVAYPLKDASKNLIGAVTAPIDLSLLAPAIEGAALPEMVLTQVINGDGYIVTSYPDRARIGKRAEGAAATANAKKLGSSTERGRDGIERVYAYTPVRGTDWVAFAGLPTSAAFADFRRQRNQILTALLVVLALAGSLALIISRLISRPLRELQRDATVLASGQLTHRSQVGARDEIGQLAASFNEMAQALEAHDVERTKSDQRIRRLNHVHAVLTGINGLIVRVHDRHELFTEACRIAVAEGGFRMAWIGIVDQSVKKLVPIASAGVEEGRLTAMKQRYELEEDVRQGDSAAALAMREKRAIVTEDLQRSTRVRLRESHAGAGNRSRAILPLVVSDESKGVLALYSEHADFFDEEELGLLAQLAGDIAFAIDHIDKQAQLDFLAYYDALTGLANRSLFLERVAQYMRSAASGGHRLAIGLVDLERFKNINDSLGRAAGDSLLRQVAAWLTRNLGDPNLSARIGADHFAVVLPEIKKEGDLARLVEKLVDALLEHPFRLGESVLRIAAKVGVAVFPDDGANADILFNNAEAALKKAKASGERYLFYTQKMTEAVAGKLTLENQLRQAIDNEEFVLHYQPKVSLETGKITSAEALIRWNDPRTGLVPPGQFIPVLEETGLIYEVGRWALRKAVEDYLRWRAAGLPAVRIAVNVSPLQLRNRGFIAEIEQVIGVDARAAAGLELEITEGLIMENIEHNIASLRAIRALGASIAIDDFGTGFSSLSYLSRLPVDTLKIDRSFVIGMTTGPQGLALVSTIIQLAHSMKLKVVAEGVETEEQSRLLRLLGCDEMQGFLFSKPVPAEIFEARFLASSASPVTLGVELSVTPANIEEL